MEENAAREVLRESSYELTPEALLTMTDVWYERPGPRPLEATDPAQGRYYLFRPQDFQEPCAMEDIAIR
eukprot:7854086-Pyramimonas_sp.AAC.1